MNVAVGSPAAFVASEVEYDSHEGSAWVGGVMQGSGMVRNVKLAGGCQSRVSAWRGRQE